MELDAITPKLVEKLLRAWRQAEDPPSEFYSLHWLDSIPQNSAIGKGLYLHARILELVAAELENYRQIEGLSTDSGALDSRQDMYAALEADFSVGNDELEAWSALYYRYLAPITPNVEDLANAAHVADRQFRRRVGVGVNLLCHALRNAEEQVHQTLLNHHLQMCLPSPDYAQLFGVQSLLTHLVALLSQEDGPHLISIEGIGGIGKTALAQATAYLLIGRVTLAGLTWISARHEHVNELGKVVSLDSPVRSFDDIIARLTRQLGQEHLAGLSTHEKLVRLRSVLSRKPHLIIIDNLETLSDVEQLLPALFPLSDTSRFILTSRYTLQHFPYVQCVPVPSLSFEHSQELVNSELERRGNRGPLADSDMHQLYQIIGGLPLALKLAAAQIPRLPLSHILEGLKRPTGQSMEGIYTYIYWRTWQLLEDSARKLLLSMLFVSPDGEEKAWIRDSSELLPSEFEQALNQLLDYSLLETTGPVERPSYRLHRLTTTFLESEILLSWDNTND
jgi:hypothetical protein